MPSLDLTPEFFTPVLPAWAGPEELDWADWRGRRLASLHTDYGWLTLASYEWLPESPSELDSVPGLWSAQDGTAHIAPQNPESPVLLNLAGEPLKGGTVTLAEGESDIVARFDAARRPFDALFRNGSRRRVDHGMVHIELGVRGGRYMIRTRLPKPELAKIPTYPYDPSWIVSAVFEPSASPYVESVASARDDTTVFTTIEGTVRFHIPGLDEEVVAAVESSGEVGENTAYTLTFSDSTNGKSTPRWRFVSVVVFGRPGPEGWAPGEHNAVIDFNRALCYPMAFGPYAVCPAPVLGNSIPAPVTAGEKALPTV